MYQNSYGILSFRTLNSAGLYSISWVRKYSISYTKVKMVWYSSSFIPLGKDLYITHKLRSISSGVIPVFFTLILFSLKFKCFIVRRGRSLFLPVAIYYIICIIYLIYFSVLSRSSNNGRCFGLNVIRKAIRPTSYSIIFTCASLRRFIKIICASFAPLDKVTTVNQLHKLVTVCGCWHSNSLPDGRRGQRKRKAIRIGRKIQIKHQSVCAKVTGCCLPTAVLDTKEVRRGAFSVYRNNPLIRKCICHSPFSPFLIF